MKKLLPYILILVVATGIIFTFSKVNAADPLGSCVIDGKRVENIIERECKMANGVWTPASTDTSYNFLAPLPGQEAFNPTGPGGGDLGKYLNVMIKLFIGVCAVLAVIMIVIGGLEYMTNELVSEKADGKNKIKGAVFGLILALGAWTLLYTINPDLLDTSLSSLTTQTVTVVLDEDIENAAEGGGGGDVFVGSTGLCTEGIKSGKNGIFVCARIVDKLDQLITAAKSANLNIGGAGYRSPERQKQKRIANCNGNFTDRNAKCTPPTALPGNSRHNNGLAVDFRCDGQAIQTHDNKCFLWLQKNAGNYGFYNLASEPWHWSVDGR